MDIRIENHGSIVLLIPVTPSGAEWLGENIVDAPGLRWGIGYVVEPRFVANVAEGAREDGLVVDA